MAFADGVTSSPPLPSRGHSDLRGAGLRSGGPRGKGWLGAPNSTKRGSFQESHPKAENGSHHEAADERRVENGPASVLVDELPAFNIKRRRQVSDPPLGESRPHCPRGAEGQGGSAENE
jgi:hypothetical protein